MKPLTNRRKFLTFAAATTASLGVIWKSFGFSPNLGPALGDGANGGDVRQFGAIGDGKADDTTAVQKAIDAGTGAVFFPKGRYRITRTLEVELDRVGYSSIRGEGSAQIVMEGPGPAFKLIGTHFKSAAPGTFSDKIWDRQRMPLLDGLAIRGDHPEAVGIEAVGTMQLTISRVHVRHARHGLHLTGNNRNLIVSDCHFYENRGIGIYYDEVNLHQSNITGCHISYNHGGGIVSRGGNVRNIHITGCDIESNMGEMEEPTANVSIDCSTSQYGTAEVAITGCTIQHNSVSPDSANIRIIGSSKTDQNTTRERWGNVTITGNILSDIMVNLHLKYCRGVAISGNTAWSGYHHNLLLENCSNIVLGANIFDMNPNYRGKDEAKNSLVLSNCEDCTISGLQISHVQDQAGLLIENSRRMNITNCTILDCDKVGLLLRNVSQSRVSGCLIRNDRPGLQFTPLETIGGEDNVILEDLPI
jgi:hypothetical protein